MIIKTGVSQWDSPTFVWLLLKEHCGMPSSFEQSGEMSVFARSEPTAMRAWRGNMWVLRMLISRFYSMLCLHWQRFSPSLSHIIFFFFGSFPQGSAVPQWVRPYVVHVGSALALLWLQQTTLHASVSPTAMNTHQKVEGHRDNTAVAKSFLPTCSPFRRQQEIFELQLLDEQNLYTTVPKSSDPLAES